MRELLQELTRRTAAGEPLALCRVVETRGSTPQKAGAAMLVFRDGSQTGTLGGGCVEAEVKRRALAILESGDAQVFSFNLESDYGWDDGLICGGRMKILVDPLRDGSSMRYFQRLGELVDAGAGCTELVVFDAETSGLSAPSSYLFDDDETLVADIGGQLENGRPPEAVLQRLEPLSGRPRPRAERGVAALPTLKRCRLLIVGGGHVGQAVGNLAVDLGFDLWVVDDREEYVSRERFPRAGKLISGPMNKVLPEIEVTPETYALIVTRGHNHDEEALFHLAERGACYVGLIGSKRKIKMIFEDLEQEGISREALARVYAPLGIHIGSQTVMEIAVSILAELISHRNRDGVVPGRLPPVLTVEA